MTGGLDRASAAFASSTLPTKVCTRSLESRTNLEHTCLLPSNPKPAANVQDELYTLIQRRSKLGTLLPDRCKAFVVWDPSLRPNRPRHRGLFHSHCLRGSSQLTNSWRMHLSCVFWAVGMNRDLGLERMTTMWSESRFDGWIEVTVILRLMGKLGREGLTYEDDARLAARIQREATSR